MISRAALLLLAAFLTLGAANALPLSHSRRQPQLCTIIWRAEVRRAQHLRSAKVAPDYPPQQARTQTTAEPRVPDHPFFHLYQRPPPVLSC